MCSDVVSFGRDNPRNHGAVPKFVAKWRAGSRDVRTCAGYFAVQFDMRRVDATVNDGHDHTGAGGALGVNVCRTDLAEAVIAIDGAAQCLNAGVEICCILEIRCRLFGRQRVGSRQAAPATATAAAPSTAASGER